MYDNWCCTDIAWWGCGRRVMNQLQAIAMNEGILRIPAETDQHSWVIPITVPA